MVGRSVPEPPRLFFRWSTAKSHSWADLGGRGTGKVAPETLPVFLVLPWSLAAPALRHKAPQRSLWLLLRHPVGTLKSAGCGHEGNPDHKKLDGARLFEARKTSMGFVVYFW